MSLPSEIPRNNTLSFLMQTHPDHPVTLYLLNLRSQHSARTQFSKLKNAVAYFGYDDPYSAEWEKFKRENFLWLRQSLLSEGKKSNTINATMSAIKGVLYEFLVKKMIGSDDYFLIKSIKSLSRNDVSRGTAIPIEDLRKMFKRPSSPIEARNNLVIALIYGCGLRRSESVKIDLSDIFKQGDGVFLKIKGKGAKNRNVPVHPAIVAYLDLWIKDYIVDKKGPLLVRIRKGDDVTGVRLTDQAIYNIIKERAVNPDIAPHDLRRSFISNLLDEGAGIETVSELVGHESTDTTKGYDLTGHRRMKKAAYMLPF